MMRGVCRTLVARTVSEVGRRRHQYKVQTALAGLGSCGRGVTLGLPAILAGAQNIHIGDDVLVGPGAYISAVNADVRIGSKVMLSPFVAIIAGNHNTAVLGRYMRDVYDKRPEDDQSVTIADDVWVGTRAIILKGVTVGRGSVVAAGAVVTRDVGPYEIVAEVPAARLRMRFSAEEVAAHERELYGRVLAAVRD